MPSLVDDLRSDTSIAEIYKQFIMIFDTLKKMTDVINKLAS